MRTLAVLLLCCAAACGPQAAEQTASSPAESDAQALADAARERLTASEGGKLLLSAIEAHGGLEAWYGAPTSSYCWEYSNAGGAGMRFKSCLTADNRTRQVYHDIVSMGTPEAVEPVQGRMAWDGEAAWIAPASIEKINPRFWATTGYYFEQIPFVLADPGVQCEALPEEELDGVAYPMVRCGFEPGVGDSPGDTYTLYVNPETHRVDAIRYTVTFYSAGRPAKKAGPPRETLFYYEDYVTVDGLTVPTHFRGVWFDDGRPGEFKNEAWASEISFSKPFDPAKLAMPPDGRKQPMPGQS